MRGPFPPEARAPAVRARVVAALGPEPRRVAELAAVTGLPNAVVAAALKIAEDRTTGPAGPLYTPEGWVWVS